MDEKGKRTWDEIKAEILEVSDNIIDYIWSLEEKVEHRNELLTQYKNMSFWQRLKFLFRPKTINVELQKGSFGGRKS